MFFEQKVLIDWLSCCNKFDFLGFNLHLSCILSTVILVFRFHVHFWHYKNWFRFWLQGKISSTTQSSSAPVWNVSALAPSTTVASVPPTTASASVNKTIQSIAQRYCVDCKTAFDEMSRMIQKVAAIRKELLTYDSKKKDKLSQALMSSTSCEVCILISIWNSQTAHLQFAEPKLFE